MSPGLTFERVYLALKAQLGEGRHPPGAPLEPVKLADELLSSITPVRDALHRLVGERLVLAPRHNGFQVPLPTEAALRDLYRWNARLVLLALSEDVLDRWPSGEEPDDAGALFQTLADRTGSREHQAALRAMNDRLSPYRHVEPEVLEDGETERRALIEALRRPDRLRARRLIGRYHRTREKLSPAILAAAVAVHER